MMQLQPATQESAPVIRTSDAADLIGRPLPRSLPLKVLGEICVGASCAKGEPLEKADFLSLTVLGGDTGGAPPARGRAPRES